MALTDYTLKNIVQLDNNITGKFSFTCSNCGEETKCWKRHSLDAALYFTHIGCAAKGKHTWCPKCAHLAH